MALKRDSEVKDHKVGLNKEPQELTFARVDSSSDVFNATLRFDAWILLF